VNGGVLPTEHPFLYIVSVTALEGVALSDVEGAATSAIDHVASDGVTEQEVIKAKNQLRARLVFEDDSVTNLAHQLGFFETVATADVYRHAPPSIASVTKEQVDRTAARYLRTDQRTVGWFKPTGTTS
jgi:zinc protease